MRDACSSNISASDSKPGLKPWNRRHIIGDAPGGKGNAKQNLFPCCAKAFNSPRMRDLERRIKAELGAKGGEARCWAYLDYESQLQRWPTSIIIAADHCPPSQPGACAANKRLFFTRLRSSVEAQAADAGFTDILRSNCHAARAKRALSSGRQLIMNPLDASSSIERLAVNQLSGPGSRQSLSSSALKKSPGKTR